MLLLTLINEQSRDSMLQFYYNKLRSGILQRYKRCILYSVIHLGSLKAAFRNPDYAKSEEIIVVPGNFSVGPLKDVHTRDGIEARFQWLEQRYLIEDDGLMICEREMKEAIEKIKNIPLIRI